MNNRKWVIGTVLALVVALGLGGWFWWGSHSFAATAPCIMEKTDVVKDGAGFWHWRVIGGHPAQPKNLPQAERMSRARAMTRCFLEAQHTLSPKVVNDLVKAVADHPEGKEVVMGNHERNDAVSEGGSVFVKNVVTDFRGASLRTSNRKAAQWTVLDEHGNTVIYQIAYDCGNQKLRHTSPPAPRKPQPKQKVVINTPAPVKCGLIPFNYAGQSDVVDDNGAAHVTAEVNMTDDEMQAFLADDCTGVIHNGHFHKVLPGCWGDCDGGMYPPDAIADLVKLPHGKPTNSFHFGCAGDCMLSVPLSYYRSTLFCVTVEQYRGVRGWRSNSRFDVVYKDELKAALPKGQLGRTLTGSMSYHVPDDS